VALELKRYATPIVLLLIAAGLGFWLWRERDSVTETERARRENNVFVAWRRDDLTKIEIAHSDETITLVREAKTDSSWRMTSPRNERVDQAATERLLTTLEFATRVRKASDEALHQLGLDAPRATGSIVMGGLTIRFALGAPSPRPEGSSYFRVDDGAPFVISRELTEALLNRSDALRDRTVVPYLSIELARFEIKHEGLAGAAGTGFVIERADDRSFRLPSLQVFASRTALDKVWGALAEMRAESFPKDADADRLTSKPQLTITMTPKDKDKPAGELVVGDVCPGHPNDVVVLRRQPTRVAACAPKGAIETLLGITPELLADKKPFGFRADEIEELRLERLDLAPDAGAGDGAGSSSSGDGGVEGAPRVIELARRGAGFHEREPIDRELTTEEADAVSDLLVRIERDASAVRPNHGAPFHAQSRVRVHSGEHDEVIEVGVFDEPNAATATLHRVRDDALLTMTTEAARRLVPRATTLRSRRLIAPSESSRSVRRVFLKCGTTQELVDEGSGLRLVEPRGYETDASISQLTDGILKGNVLTWVWDSDDGSFGLSRTDQDDAKGCRVVLSFTDNNAPITLRFGRQGEGGYYGAIDGRPEVFAISTGMYELARRIYVSHSSMRAEGSRIESVRVKVNDRLVSTGRNLDELRDAASGLFADRVLTLGSSDLTPDKPEVDIEIRIAEGGAPKKVTCGPVTKIDGHSGRRCAVAGVKAVFEVLPPKVAKLIDAPASDHEGADASKNADAASREKGADAASREQGADAASREKGTERDAH